MSTNLIIYADSRRQVQTAGSLIVFGAEKFKQAKIVAGLDKLKKCNDAMQQGLEYDRIELVQEFIWDYLIDCVRILIFFRRIHEG